MYSRPRTKPPVPRTPGRGFRPAYLEAPLEGLRRGFTLPLRGVGAVFRRTRRRRGGIPQSVRTADLAATLDGLMRREVGGTVIRRQGPKIKERLARLYPDVHTPPISTLHTVLDRHGLVQRRTRRRNRAEGTTLSRPLQPNEL